MSLPIDHLVFAAPDLNEASDRFHRLTGIRATPGGSHPGRGTRNALVALGRPDVYLEIIGPDPDQPDPRGPRLFGIDSLNESRLVTWAAKATTLGRLVRNAARAGIVLGPVAAGSRKAPDGILLSWQFTDPRTVVADGIVPFFIDWGATPHPARTAAAGAKIVNFRAVHPDARRVQTMLDRLGLDLSVSEGRAPRLIATIDTPRGRIELR